MINVFWSGLEAFSAQINIIPILWITDIKFIKNEKKTIDFDLVFYPQTNSPKIQKSS